MGYGESYGATDDDLFLAKYDTAGNLIGNLTWGGVGDDRAYDIKISSSGYLGITGDTNNFGTNKFDMLFMNVSTSCTLEWNKTFGSAAEDRAQGLSISNNQVYLVGYTNRTESTNGYDTLLIKLKIDESGNGGVTTPPPIPGFEFMFILMAFALIIIGVVIRRREQKTLL